MEDSVPLLRLIHLGRDPSLAGAPLRKSQSEQTILGVEEALLEDGGEEEEGGNGQ